jgi:RNA polymerase sigma-70 factor, ECF subfamily
VTVNQGPYEATKHNKSFDVRLIARTESTSRALSLRAYSDVDLIALIGNEDDDVYAELYRRYSAEVAAVARRILVDNARTEDVVADVFVWLWLFPEKFDPRRGSLLRSLQLRARSRSIEIHHSESARRRREASEFHVEHHHQTGADARIVKSESAYVVREAVALLPVLEREAIHLAYFVGMPYTEVAHRLSVPEGTVKSRIRAGLSHLRANKQLRLLRADNDLSSTAQTSVDSVCDASGR